MELRDLLLARYSLLIIFVLRNPINTNRYTTILLDIDETEPYPMAAKVFAWSIARIKNA